MKWELDVEWPEKTWKRTGREAFGAIYPEHVNHSVAEYAEGSVTVFIKCSCDKKKVFMISEDQCDRLGISFPHLKEALRNAPRANLEPKRKALSK